jgi:cytochrome c-type biogenesis protein CcmH
VLILYFLAILAGAGLALAWYYLSPPLLAGVAGLSLMWLRHGIVSRRALGVLLVLPLPVIAVIFYLRGEEPDTRPVAGRNAALTQAQKEAPHDLAAATEKLAARLKDEPGDRDGWLLLSRSYALLGDTAKAAEAARHAESLADTPAGEADVQSATAEGLVTAANGTVTPEALLLFEKALAADPRDPRARFFVGLAEAQAGKSEEALKSWLALEAESPPDAPWREGLNANIERLAGQMSLDPTELAKRRATFATAIPPAAAPTTAAPGPSQADVAAAATMSPDDRQAMIKSMVERLAARLQSEPGDVDGWLRLGRAYAVLGEKEKSLDALRHAAEADPKRADARDAYAGARAAAGGTP